MNAPLVKEPVSRPAPEWLRDLVAARVHYEERLGWPVSVRIVERQVAVGLGGVVDAITMPRELAVRVHAGLGVALQAGPVIAPPDGGRWTFLTQPMPPGACGRGEFVDGLAKYGVEHVGAGAFTVLPRTESDPEWRWVTEPRPGHALPSPYAVVAVVRSCLFREGGPVVDLLAAR